MLKLEMAGMMEAAAMRPPEALSIGRNLVMLPTAAINPAIPLIGVGASAAADKMYQLSAQGKSAQEALARGAVSGGIEAVTEYLPLHSLMDLVKVGSTSAAVGILKQVGTEAGEEGVSYFLNYLADKAAKDPNAKFDWGEFWQSVGQGGLSGLFFGVAGTAAHASADGVYEVSGDSDASIEGAGEIFSPINPGTLSDEVASTFRSSTYTKKVLTEDTVFYRVYGGDAEITGNYMSRTPQMGGLQSQLDLALVPEWGNTATNVTKVTVPKGTVIYEGFAAPQTINGGAGMLMGGGSQIYIPEARFNPSWFGK